MQNLTQNSDAFDSDSSHNEPSFSDLCTQTIIQNRKMIFSLWVGSTVLGYLYALTLPNIYTAKARILPPQSQQSSLASMLSQLPINIGSGSSLSKDPSQLYVSLLKTNVIAYRIVERFDLRNHYKKKTVADAREMLATQVAFVSGNKDSLITIEVDDTDPKKAAQLANTFSEELNTLLQSLNISEAAQRRKFFEFQLQQSKQQLTEAEINFKELQEKSGILRLEDQGRAIIEAISTLRAQIAAKEVEIQTLRSAATEANAKVKYIQAEIGALRLQLSQLEKSSSGQQNSSQLNFNIDKLPSKGMEYIRRYRDLKYQETIYELMIKQFEVAKLDEARTSQAVQLVDPALIPERRSKPKRSIIALLMGLIGLVGTTVYVCAKKLKDQHFNTPA